MTREHVRKGSWLALALLLWVGAPAAEVTVDGFVEGATGVRTANNPQFDGVQDYTLQEARAQLRFSSYGDIGEAFARLDFLQDQVMGGPAEIEIREAFLRFTTIADKLDVKAGRQIATWGTGDLIFINDLFPRDWVSFFIGREMQYLRAPFDAARLGIFGLPIDIDLVLTPYFTPDRIGNQRLSFFMPEIVSNPPQLPNRTLDNGEAALRLSRYIAGFNIALYGYWGFYPTPVGITINPDSTGSPFYPKLNVYGASGRGGLAGGVLWLEGGYYDSREDKDGSNPLIENSSLRYLLGYERQFWTDFTAGLQYYGEWMQDYDQYKATLPDGAPRADEIRHLLTLRLEQWLLYQTLRLSLFTYVSPSDEDA
jgi:hypothetical protein